MNTKRAPKVRFKGFTDAWEQRKLGEFGKATGGTSIESEFSETGRYKVISIGSYSETSTYTDQGIRADKTNKTESRILNKDDLTMILNDKTTSGNIIGRVLLIDADNTYVYNQRTERIEVNKNEYEPQFLYQLLNADNIRKKIIRASQGNTQIYVNWSAISELEYFVPISKSEQRQIGNFFHNLDNLITLHQRKLDKMKELKKAFLNLIFSQKLRFYGSNQSWRKLKIEDCFSERVERSEKGELISVTVNFGIVKAHSLARKDNSSKNKSHYKIVRKDDIAYNSMRMWQGASGISLYEGILSPAYTVIVPKQGISSLFFSYEFKLKKMLQTFQVNSQGLTSDTWNLKFPLLKNIVVEVPEYEEQEKVGIFFKKLDNLITLHQEKINQLTKLKTTFLKNMFI